MGKLELPRVTTILAPFLDFSKVPSDVLEAAQERGTAVHEACAAYALGLYSPVSEELAGYFESFRSWFDRFVVEVCAVEERVEHPKLGYCGHLDFIGLISGVRPKPVMAIVDYKSPMVESLTWHAQCAAYKEAAKEKYHVEVCGALMLRKDGSLPKMVWIDDEPRAFAAFCAALSAYNYFKGK